MHTAAIQLISPRRAELALSPAERSAVAAVAPELSVFWLPARIPTEWEERNDTTVGYSLETIVLIYLLGVSLGALLKPLVQSAATEAGKDLWAALKRLIGKTWSTQQDKAYRLSSNTYIVTELGADHAAIRIQYPHEDVTLTEAELVAHIEKQIQTLLKDASHIQMKVEKFHVGAQPSGQVHLLFEGKSWEVRPVESRDFLNFEGSTRYE